VALVRGPGLEIDVDRFRADVAAGRLEAAAERFRGEFLEGFGLRDAPAFEDWHVRVTSNPETSHRRYS
jgi:hypothetical protein